MTWARFEDRFPWHRKIRPLSDAAFRLHVSGICWATEHLTDGFIPRGDLEIVSDVRKPGRPLAELIERSLWVELRDGWEINDYLTYNQSAEQVTASREAAAERQRRAREASARRRESQGESRRDFAESSGDEAVPPSRPVPTPASKTSSSSLPERFDEFWQAYPRRVGKGQAVKAWKTAVRKTDADVIITAAVSYAAAQQGKDPQYVAHPATWLNGERWLDEAPSHLRVVGDAWYPGKGGSWDV